MSENKSLKDNLKYCGGPFIFSAAFLLIFILANILDWGDIKIFFCLLNLPVSAFFFRQHANFYVNIPALLVSVFIYWFVIMLIIKMLYRRKNGILSFFALLFFALLYTVFFLPVLGEEREPARRISCNSNLKQIGLSLMQYTMDNNDYYPDKEGAEGFEMLRKNDYLTDYKIYICPSALEKTGRDGLKEANVSYHYRAGEKYSKKNRRPVAWDRYENHNNKNERSAPLFRMKNYGNVLLADGSVVHYDGAEWKKFCEDNTVKEK